MLIIGAGGGAGRAVARQCAAAGCERLVLVNRTPEKARALADSLGECGCPVRYGVYAFCTNGSESAGRRGIPTIGLGPGAEADAHTIDESISIDELEQARRIYRALTLRLAGDKA